MRVGSVVRRIAESTTAAVGRLPRSEGGAGEAADGRLEHGPAAARVWAQRVGWVRSIDAGHLDRVHILPVRKHTIKHELFTVEGTGTLIANDFQEAFLPILNEEDEQLLAGILQLYKNKGYLKPRDRAYIAAHRDNFYMTQIDGIAVGCVELLPIDRQTAELGALAISTRFHGQRIGVFTVNSFIAEARKRGYQRIISLTKNPRLQTLYRNLGFLKQSPRQYSERQARSAGTPMFVKELRSASSMATRPGTGIATFWTCSCSHSSGLS